MSAVKYVLGAFGGDDTDRSSKSFWSQFSSGFPRCSPRRVSHQEFVELLKGAGIHWGPAEFPKPEAVGDK